MGSSKVLLGTCFGTHLGIRETFVEYIGSTLGTKKSKESNTQIGTIAK